MNAGEMFEDDHRESPNEPRVFLYIYSQNNYFHDCNQNIKLAGESIAYVISSSSFYIHTYYPVFLRQNLNAIAQNAHFL